MRKKRRASSGNSTANCFTKRGVPLPQMLELRGDAVHVGSEVVDRGQVEVLHSRGARVPGGFREGALVIAVARCGMGVCVVGEKTKVSLNTAPLDMPRLKTGVASAMGVSSTSCRWSMLNARAE